VRILLVYFEPQISGQTAHVRSLVQGLDRGRFDLAVALPDCLPDAAADFQQTGTLVVPLSMRKVAWSPRAVAAFARLIREWQPDLVHVHSQEAGLVARPIARLAGARRVLYTPQTIDIRRAQWAWLYQCLERILARVTATIVSVNEADRRRLMSWGILPGKVVAIPNGIELSGSPGAVDATHLRYSLGLDPGRPLVLQVGRLSAQKDPRAFVEGAALVLGEFPGAQFALVGDGPLLDSVAARVRELGLESDVHLLGWREDAARLMPAADIVTLTSRWEGAPYALLEAMACSRPVVATAVNGCPEIIVEGQTGFLVPPGESAAWGAAVVKLLDDPMLAGSMGHQGRKRLEERFSRAEMIQQIEAIYQQAG
jgi:glycosyltransferase involved in cell wall biosynthesis